MSKNYRKSQLFTFVIIFKHIYKVLRFFGFLRKLMFFSKNFGKISEKKDLFLLHRKTDDFPEKRATHQKTLNFAQKTLFSLLLEININEYLQIGLKNKADSGVRNRYLSTT